ncbi:hypothetical protein HMPREF0880_02651 [Yokenella regensburgei ATCC 43003]|nr:hypothetical protein HMPREF0880_02651 [Yokenella regensburgei ATCC 43003]
MLNCTWKQNTRIDGFSGQCCINLLYRRNGVPSTIMTFSTLTWTTS